MAHRQAPIVTGDMDQDRRAGLEAFERISQAFAEAFSSSEGEAYGQLLRDLMDNSSLLISGGLMSVKEVLDKIEDLQQHLKRGGSGSRSPIDLFSEWLNGNLEA